MGDYRIVGRPAHESTWRRAWDDSESIRKSWGFWFFYGLLTILTAVLVTVFVDDEVVRIVVPGIVFVVFPAFIVISSVFNALPKQRDEARSEVERLLDLRTPELTVIIEPQRFLPAYSLELQAQQMISAYGIRIKNASDVAAATCAATIVEINESTKYIPQVDERGGYTTRLDDFDIGWVSNDVPRPLIWPDKCTTSRLPPRGEVVIDVFHHMWEGEKPIKLNTPTTVDTHELEDEELLFIISVGDENSLPIYVVIKYMPNVLSKDSWSLVFSGLTCPELKDYQSFEPIQS